jgi:preprotein translocase subunit SecD
MLAGIVVLAVVAILIAWPTSPGIHIHTFSLNIDQDFPIREGLDLQGGIQVLLQADTSALPPGTQIDPSSMQAAESIVAKRVDALGVSEPVVQLATGNRIIVQLPGLKDPDQAIKTFGQTGLLEFIDAGSSYIPPGTVVTTSLGPPAATPVPTPGTSLGAATPTTGTPVGGTPIPATPGSSATSAASGSAATPGAGTPVASPTASAASPTPQTNAYAGKVFTTILTGKDLANADVAFDQTTGQPIIQFTLTSDGAKKFGDFTQANVGKYLAITMDKQVIECPVIQQPILGGSGQISGNFTLQSAQAIAIQLKYGSLPIPLKVVDSMSVGPTLGAQAIHQSITAGLIGLGIVLGFMLLYYRIPGLLADIALLIYAATTFAIFRIIPVTLTLAGIAGFILSIGMAVDANILIFERMKEELRAGRGLHAAIDHGFDRAWTSIRDSNFSTLITCAILYWFGSTFGASIIQGFALTLAIGVLVSLFTAVTVSRTFIQLLVESGWVRDHRWYGLPETSRPVAAPVPEREGVAV